VKHHSSKTEKILLAHLGNLDENALAEVYDTFHPRLYRYAYRLVGHTETAEDIVAETFQRLLLALYENRGPRRHLQAWLYRVAHNLVMDHYRKQPRNPPLPLEEALPSHAEGPDDLLQLRLTQERIRWALRQLTPDQRQVIVLKFLEEMSNREVARVVGKTVGAVKSLQHRGLASLRRILDSLSNGEEEER
jgi:RNA polymerase sigma-70 factor (ECF subfamily)